jgi:hypothetical protein
MARSREGTSAKEEDTCTSYEEEDTRSEEGTCAKEEGIFKTYHVAASGILARSFFRVRVCVMFFFMEEGILRRIWLLPREFWLALSSVYQCV